MAKILADNIMYLEYSVELVMNLLLILKTAGKYTVRQDSISRQNLGCLIRYSQIIHLYKGRIQTPGPTYKMFSSVYDVFPRWLRW